MLTGLLLAGLAANVACTVLNDIDVCEREPGPVSDVNRRTENNQYYVSAAQMVRGSQDTWLTLWASDLPSDPGVRRTELRLARLDATGDPLTTCGAEAELTIVSPPTPEVDTFALAYSSVLAGSVDLEQDGLAVWGFDDGATTQIRGRYVSPQGCVFETSPEFVVHEVDGACATLGDRPVGSGTCLSPIRAVPLDVTQGGGAEFVVVWREVVGAAAGALKARVFESLLGADFLPTALDEEGNAANLFVGSREPFQFDTVALGDGLWALAWVELALGGEQSVWLQYWDDRLQSRGPPVELGRSAHPGSFNVAVERVGPQVGVVYSAEQDALRIVLVDITGNITAYAEVRPGGGSTDWPHLQALSQDAIVVAWSEQAESDSSGSAQIRARLLDGHLAPTFSNPGCGPGAFSLTRGAGDNRSVNLGVSAPGGLLAAWTSSGARGDDRSGTGIRTRYYGPSALRP